MPLGPLHGTYHRGKQGLGLIPAHAAHVSAVLAQGAEPQLLAHLYGVCAIRRLARCKVAAALHRQLCKLHNDLSRGRVSWSDCWPAGAKLFANCKKSKSP